MKKNILILLVVLMGALNAQNLIVEGEYFFNSDPGFGNGIPISFTADSIVNINFDADISSLADGFNMLFVRIKDDSAR